MVEFLAAIWASRALWIGLMIFGLFISWLTKEEPKGEVEEKGKENE